MVSQIPSLMSSLAAGILTTRIVGRAEEGSNLGRQVSLQIGTQRAALYATAAVVGSMALIPGFPAFTFLILAAAIAGGVWWTTPKGGDDDRKNASWQVDSLAIGANQNAIDFRGQTMALDSNTVVPLQIRLAAGLRQQLKPAVLHDALAYQERMLKQALGRGFPQTSVQFDATLPDQTVAIDVQELEFDRWTLRLDKDSDNQSPEPAIAARVALAVRLRPDAFVGTEELLAVVEHFREANAALYGEVMRAVPPTRVLEVLKLLASEYVSLRLLREIFEALLVWAPREKDSVLLTERVRAELARFIVVPLLNEQKRLDAVFVPPNIEQAIVDGLAKLPKGAVSTDGLLAPDMLSSLIAELDRISGSLPPDSLIVLLTNDPVRPALRQIINPVLPAVQVLAYSSLPPDTVIVPIGQIDLAGSDQADRLTKQEVS